MGNLSLSICLTCAQFYSEVITLRSICQRFVRTKASGFDHQRKSSIHFWKRKKMDNETWMHFTNDKRWFSRTLMIDSFTNAPTAFKVCRKDSLQGGAQVEESSNREPSEKGASLAIKNVGAFQHLPRVASSSELLGSALRKAKMIRPTQGIMNIAKRERNRGAKQLDFLTKELAVPLRIYTQGFPERQELHAYESSLIELTFGTGSYEEVLEKVNLFRKKILNVGKNCTSLCAKILRIMPVVDLKVPTLCLVGAPNVGKSSLVRVLSTGKPEVCNYPFTTRGISMGHIFIDHEQYQVTDTPGLLKRPDDERNSMEKLTLSALSHLETAILFVHDLTGDSGTTISDQFEIYTEIKERFSSRPWLDAVSKADLLSHHDCCGTMLEPKDLYRWSGPPGAVHVSVQTSQGIEELKEKVHLLLAKCKQEKRLGYDE
eukprot:c22040_g1_i2 orf=407-1699(+)